MNDLLLIDEAIKLGKEGFAVIPLHRYIPERKRFSEEKQRVLSLPETCTCDEGKLCTAAGKHPMHAGYFKVATTDEKAIRELFKRAGLCNLGVVLGKSYHCALDVDERNGGFESLSLLMEDCGIESFAGNRMAMSGSGSLHIIFSCWSEKIRSGEMRRYPGIDIKGSFGADTILVSPPSNHKSGGFYKWINRCEAKDAPDEIMSRMVHNRIDKGASPYRSILKHDMVIDLLNLLPDWEYKTLSNGLRGAHPVHGSTTGSNFIIFPNDGVWYCFRHGSTGGLLELASMLAGTRKCDDFVQGTYKPLKADERHGVIKYCLEHGISRDDLVKFFTLSIRGSNE